MLGWPLERGPCLGRGQGASVASEGWSAGKEGRVPGKPVREPCKQCTGLVQGC